MRKKTEGPSLFLSSIAFESAGRFVKKRNNNRSAGGLASFSSGEKKGKTEGWNGERKKNRG